jgi:hypothetical protein
MCWFEGKVVVVFVPVIVRPPITLICNLKGQIGLVTIRTAFLFSFPLFFFLNCSTGATLWRLQKFLECIKYIILEFTPLLVLFSRKCKAVLNPDLLAQNANKCLLIIIAWNWHKVILLSRFVLLSALSKSKWVYVFLVLHLLRLSTSNKSVNKTL